jgi:hypothetical protein
VLYVLIKWEVLPLFLGLALTVLFSDVTIVDCVCVCVCARVRARARRYPTWTLVEPLLLLSLLHMLNFPTHIAHALLNVFLHNNFVLWLYLNVLLLSD